MAKCVHGCEKVIVNFGHFCGDLQKVLQQPGIEPGTTAWKAAMLTATPSGTCMSKDINHDLIPSYFCK